MLKDKIKVTVVLEIDMDIDYRVDVLSTVIAKTKVEQKISKMLPEMKIIGMTSVDVKVDRIINEINK